MELSSCGKMLAEGNFSEERRSDPKRSRSGTSRQEGQGLAQKRPLFRLDQPNWATVCQLSGNRGRPFASSSERASMRGVVNRIQPLQVGQRPAKPVPSHQARTRGLYMFSGSP